MLTILLPGRSYGNQDTKRMNRLHQQILLPGRSYGNQDLKALLVSL